MNTSCKEEDKLYRIGLFSKMNHVTIKALRHYDEVGLLKPQFIDPENGYRYYSSDQLPTLHQLLALRKIGCTLEEIKAIQQGQCEETALRRKKQQLLKDIAEKTAMLALLEGYTLTKAEEAFYHVILKELPEVHIASMRSILPTHHTIFSAMPLMGSEMERLNCVCAEPEYCFNIYHDNEYREENIDVEICQSVVEKKTDSAQLTFKTLPRVETAVCTLHKGSYDGLPKAYAALVRFIEANGFTMVDSPRESYIDGIWNKDSEQDWLTEIQFPVCK